MAIIPIYYVTLTPRRFLYIEYIANENGLSGTDTAALLQGVDTIVAILMDSLNGMSAEDILAGNILGNVLKQGNNNFICYDIYDII